MIPKMITKKVNKYQKLQGFKGLEGFLKDIQFSQKEIEKVQKSLIG